METVEINMLFTDSDFFIEQMFAHDIFYWMNLSQNDSQNLGNSLRLLVYDFQKQLNNFRRSHFLQMQSRLYFVMLIFFMPIKDQFAIALKTKIKGNFDKYSNPANTYNFKITNSLIPIYNLFTTIKHFGVNQEKPTLKTFEIYTKGCLLDKNRSLLDNFRPKKLAYMV